MIFIEMGLLDYGSTNTKSGLIILGWLKSGIGGGFLFFLFWAYQSLTIFSISSGVGWTGSSSYGPW